MENIVLSKLDKDFKYEVASRPGANFFKRCFSCGTCTASCPVSEIDDPWYDRQTMPKVLAFCEDLTEQVPAYELQFTPNQQVADVLEEFHRPTHT